MDQHPPTPDPFNPDLFSKSDVLKSMFKVHGAMLLIAVVILWARQVPVWEQLNAPLPWATQLAYGVGIGLVSSLIGVLVGNRWSILNEVSKIVEFVLQLLKPNYALLLGISLMAGVVEELLFRAAIQPVAGIWITALLFMLAHGFAPLRFQALLVYLSILFLAGVWLGIAYEKLGLLCVIALHTVHNSVVFAFALRAFRSKDSKTPSND